MQREIPEIPEDLRLELQLPTPPPVLMLLLARQRAAEGQWRDSAAWADPGAPPTPRTLTLSPYVCGEEADSVCVCVRAHTHTYTHTGRMEAGMYRWQRWMTLSLN